jgi:hypothetical protein
MPNVKNMANQMRKPVIPNPILATRITILELVAKLSGIWLAKKGEFGVKFPQSKIRRGKGYVASNNWNFTSTGGICSRHVFFSSKPRYEYFTFFRFLPSVHTYYMMLKAIKNLKIESLLIEDLETGKAKGEVILTEKDKGFKELVALLKREQYIPKEGKVENLKLWAMSTIPSSHMPRIYLQCLNATINGNKDKYLIGPYDAQHQLKEMADVFVRGKITTFIVILAFIILVLSIFLIVWAKL